MTLRSDAADAVITVTEAYLLVPEVSGGLTDILSAQQLHLAAASAWASQPTALAGSGIEKRSQETIVEEPLILMSQHPQVLGSQGLLVPTRKSRE